MIKSLKLFSIFIIITPSVFSQSPSASIATWKNDAQGAYTIVHDDYGDRGVDGIWQYADTIAFNRGLRFTFGAIASSCEENRNINGYSSPYAYARDVMMAQHNHEIINHSHDHSCAVGNAGWTPCNASEGWGERESNPFFDRELDDAHASIISGTGYTPVYYIFPFDRFSDLANNRLKSLGYIGSRTGWTSPLGETFSRNGYNNNDLNSFTPDNDGFFRTAVQVFDDAMSNLSDQGQVNILNGTVDDAISNSQWGNRELHNVGPTGWGNVSINAYRSHLNYVQTKVNSGELYMAPASEILTYQIQKLKYQPNVSYDNLNTIDITWNIINPSINVNVSTYLANLTYKTSATIVVDLDGLTGDWQVIQNGNTAITDFVVNGNQMIINAYPHEGPLEIKRIIGVPNTNPEVTSNIPTQNLNIAFSSYQIDLKAYFEDAETTDENLIYTFSGNTDIQVSILNGIATISASSNYTGSEVITFSVEDEGGLTVSQNVTFNVVDENLGQLPFNNTPIIIPSIIEAEDFDLGDEDIAYNEEFSAFEPNPNLNPYRANHPVDIEEFSTNNYCVGYTVQGEWLEYSIYSELGGDFTFSMISAQLNLGGTRGKVKLYLDGVAIGTETETMYTSDWYDFDTIDNPTVFQIPSGNHILRLEIVEGDVNIDKFEIKSIPTNSTFVLNNNEINLFPNPANEFVTIKGDFGIASFYNTSGQLVLASSDDNIDISSLVNGLYFVRFQNSSKILKLIVN